MAMSKRLANIIALAVIGITISGVTITAYAEERVLGVESRLVDLAMEGKDLIFRRKFDEAIKLFDDIERQYPDSATGLFGKMVIWQVRMFENEDFRFQAEYSDVERVYIKFAQRRLRDGNLPAWEYFVYGAADGARGFFNCRRGGWLKALTEGLHAIRMFKKLKWLVPDFIDADIGLGVYKYFRSYFTSRIKILPFFSDQREEGIQMVRKVAQDGIYTREMAQVALVFIYDYDSQYKNALEYADKINARYPENIIVRFLEGQIKMEMKRYDEALATFEDIYNRDHSISKALLNKGIILYHKKDYSGSKAVLERYLGTESERYWQAVVYYWLGRDAEALGDKGSAISNYEESLRLYKMTYVKNRLQQLK